MSRLKYLATVILLIGLVAASGCSWFGSGSAPNASSGPINPEWEPSYIDDDVSALLTTSELVELVAPTVVSILTEKITRDIFFQPVPQTGAGSGVIVDPKGYVVTNHHVIEGANDIKVVLSDGRSFKALKWASDAWTDLAVLQIKPEGDAAEFPFAHFLRDSLEKLEVLEPLVAVGNALALPGGPTWTSGGVSYLGRSIQLSGGTVLEDLIQTDAAINPGNSGGPLFNMSGQVVGINTAIAAEAENIGFAVSTSTAIDVINNLVRKQHVPSAWLGVSVYTVTGAVKSQYNLAVDSGAFIVEVFSDSPADVAGLRPNDVITAVDGQPITAGDELGKTIRGHDPGDTVTITLLRGSQQMQPQATLVQRPSAQ